MIKYIGSKRRLLPEIIKTFKALSSKGRLLDLFSGTARVSHAAKAAGFYVIANDHNAYAHTLATCYVEADAEKYQKQAERIIRHLRMLKPREGFFTETYCVKSRFFHPKNGARIDAIRDWIENNVDDTVLKAILLTSLMEAADRVDSTTGVQMAYLKQWAPRAYNDLEMRLPKILPGAGKALMMDALEAAKRIECDIAYLDPPYNQHSYRGNYHIWETLVRWDFPEVYGKACKRLDCREYQSPFNSKRKAHQAMQDVVDSISAPYMVISFNNEGFIRREEMEALLSRKGFVNVIAIKHPRYVGSKIGIYNPQGKKVGKVSHTENKEFLYIVSQNELSGSILPSLGMDDNNRQLLLIDAA